MLDKEYQRNGSMGNAKKEQALKEDRNSPTVQIGAIVLPAHNEEAAIKQVIEEIQEISDLEIILVDDASTDNTREIAQSLGIHVLSPAYQLGAWGATQTGLRYAYRLGAHYAVTMDSDGQHEAQYIQALIKPIQTGEADVVIGSFVGRGSRLRKVAWFILRNLCKLSVMDITSGFRAYNRYAMEVLASRQATLLEFQDVGVLMGLGYADMRVTEIPVVMRSRTNGPSRIFYSWWAVAYYMFYSVILGFSKLGHSRKNVL
jgi:glycosyltransferase involved in cell wall biosynthesis